VYGCRVVVLEDKELSMNCGCPPGGCICQSCAMPMKEDKHYGTNEDKSKSCDYCFYCYREGKFLNPTMTLDQMINKVTEFMKKRNMPQATIDQVKTIVPTLKRWVK